MEDTVNNAASEDIRLVYAGPETATPGSRFGPVIRSVYIIECCTGGCGSVIINGKEFQVTAGTCYVLMPGDAVIHTSDAHHSRQGCWCALEGVSVGTYLQALGITADMPYAPAESFAQICQCIQTLADQWKCRDAGAQLRQTACVYWLLGTMLQGKPMAKKASLVDNAIGFMQTNYPEPLNISQLAQQVGLERTYFSDLFKEKTGLSPYRYLLRLRMQKACQLIAQGHSVTQTAYLVGMDPHNFGRAFKKEVGHTPREYLHLGKEKGGDILLKQVLCGRETRTVEDK